MLSRFISSLIAEELNLHFSLVFTREDTSALPVTVTKFNGTEGERLGQLVVTPDVVVSNTNSMNNYVTRSIQDSTQHTIRNCHLHKCLTCLFRRELF